MKQNRFFASLRMTMVLRITVALIVFLSSGLSAWAANTWTVEYVNGKFRISRSGDLSITETVQYRTVSLSAFAGQHFTAISGTETFGPNQDVKEVSVSEATPGTDAYLYQNGTSRTYRFEVLDLGGFCLASCDRTITTGTNVPNDVFNQKTGTIRSSEFTINDSGYKQSGNPYTINSSSFYNDNAKNYLSFLGVPLHMTLELQAKEIDDAYQYLQVIIDNTTGCDSETSASGGNPGTPSISSYMAGFEMRPKHTYSEYKTYTFPVPNIDDGKKVNDPWGYGTDFPLSMQKFKSDSRSTDYKIIVPNSFNTISVRFDASGSEGTDEWMVKNLKAKITAIDGTRPTRLADPLLPPYGNCRHAKGNTYYVSVPFSEIVKVTGTPTLSTSWGTLSYFSGDGSNVLTFRGTITADANTSLNVGSISGTIKDMAGNELSINHKTINKDYSQTVAASYAYSISYDLAGGSVASANPDSYTYETPSFTLNNPIRPGYAFAGWTGSNGSTPETTVTISGSHGNKTFIANWTPLWGQDNGKTGEDEAHAYVITSPAGLDMLAMVVNGTDGYTRNSFSGQFFKLGDNITYTYDGSENNYTSIGNYPNTFHGNFDGDDYTVSGIYINSSNDCQGLFGYLYDCTVKNLTLKNSTIIGQTSVGGIVGCMEYSSVLDCRVESTVTIGNNAAGAWKHGGVVGASHSSTVANCTSAANVTGGEYSGGIVGLMDHAIIRNCLALGATVTLSSSDGGAIVGNNSGTLANNYYRDCTVGSAHTNVGTGDGDCDGARSVHTLTLPTDVTASGESVDIDNVTYFAANTALNLSYTGAALSEGYTYAVSINGTRATDNGNGTYTATMPAEDATVTVSTVAKDFTADGHSGDSEADAYIIYNKDQLDLLATRVNSGTGDDYANSCYSGKFIKLGADIEYDGTENNYTPIGSFFGTFDGDGHTISGININRNIDNQGLFGSVTGGTVQNVTLANSTITGGTNVGGIVGHILYGTIQNCRVESTVTIGADADHVWRHGGIVGDNSGGTIIGCASAATISHNNHNSCAFFGAIAGSNSSTIQNCLALGATVTLSSIFGGAIVGNNSGTLANNYYLDCTVGTTDNATNVGVGSSSGAPADQAGARSVHALTLLAGAPASGESVDIDATTYFAAGTTVTLSLGSAPAGYQEPFLGYSLNGTPFEGNSFEMPAADATVTALWTVADFETGHAGTEADPYIIYNKDQLDQLATRVNGGTDYSGKYIKLADDITYSHTTDWNDATSTEVNFTPIGDFSGAYYFKGTFDGDGHIISGIRAKTYFQGTGLFGTVRGGTIKNVTLSDARITGGHEVGGIVGNIDQDKASGISGIIKNCHVTNTVAIHGAGVYATDHGGIVGIVYSGATVSGCVSAATLTIKELTGSCNYGGIVGQLKGNLQNCIAIDATINGLSPVGAIVGLNNGGTFSHNYYRGCTANSATTNIGTGNGDITDNDGAVRAVSSTTKPAEIGVQIATYPHIGLTVYEHGAYYNGTYYLRHDLAGTAVGLNLTQGTKDGVTAWWGTFYDGTTNHTLSEGTAAYTLGTDYNLYRLGDDGRTIPAGTAVVIIAASADAAIVPAGTAALSITDHAPGGNILVGNDSATPYPTVYVLSVSAGEVGFRKLSGGTLPAHKAGYQQQAGMKNYDRQGNQNW